MLLLLILCLSGFWLTEPVRGAACSPAFSTGACQAVENALDSVTHARGMLVDYALMLTLPDGAWSLGGSAALRPSEASAAICGWFTAPSAEPVAFHLQPPSEPPSMSFARWDEQAVPFPDWRRLITILQPSAAGIQQVAEEAASDDTAMRFRVTYDGAALIERMQWAVGYLPPVLAALETTWRGVPVQVIWTIDRATGRLRNLSLSQADHLVSGSFSFTMQPVEVTCMPGDPS